MTILDLSATTTTNIFVLIAAIAVAAIVVPVVLMFAFVFAARIFRRDRMECRQTELDRVHDRTMRYMKALHLTSKETAKNSAPIDPTKMFSSALGHQTCQDEHMSDLLLEGLQKLLHTPNK